eukprot:TRINITY_DN4073_c0_g1_i1.p1 TRINITY_DN4073_c0_g1~~TRINITY_DN4073_c0_g1_i1.p1  ORF type:complete len:538 (+),score=258.21 TRINITY_DN4073_c0_g1_i1:58-1671(+)
MPNEKSRLYDEEEDRQSVQTVAAHEEASLGMWLSVVPTVLAPLLFGYALGYTSPTFRPSGVAAGSKDYFDVAMAMSDNQKTWIGSLPNFGAAAGALLGGMPVDAFGKKAGMCMSNLMYAIGFTLLVTTPIVVPFHEDGHGNATADHDNTASIAQLYVSRIVLGVGMGLSCVATPAYQTEISTTNLRGVLGSAFQISIVTGLVLADAVGFGMTWQPMAYMGLAMACVGMVLCALIPESPQWLVNKGRNDKAEVALRKMRSPGTDFAALLSNLHVVKTESELELESKGDKLGELLKYPRNKALAIGVGLMIMQQLTGINAVMGYASNIFSYAISDSESSEDKAHWSNMYAMFGQILQLVVTLIAARVTTAVDRKKMLTIAAGGMIVSTAVMEIYFFSGSTWSEDKTVETKSMSGLFAVVGLMMYIASFACGMGAIPWLMLGELFHPGIRSTASAVCTAVNWMLSFAVMKTVTQLQDGFGGGKTGMGWVFFFYCSVIVVGIALVNIFTPETRGKSYNAVERELRGKKKQGYENVDADDEF